MKLGTRMILIAAAGMLSTLAHAETRTLQLWTCTVNTGKTLADVQAVDTKWLKFVNSKVKGGDIHSSVASPVTGSLDHFMFIDSFPSIEAWAAQQTVMATPEGAALNAEFDAVTKCTAGNLYSSNAS
jgi:hypothetical protein